MWVGYVHVFNSKYFVVLEWGWAMETRPGIRFSCLRTQLHDSGKFKLTPHKIFLHTYLLYKLLEFWNRSIFSVYRSWSCCMRTQQKIQPVKRGKHIFIPLEMLISRSGSTSSCTSPPAWTAASRRSFPPAPAFDHTAGTMSRYLGLADDNGSAGKSVIRARIKTMTWSRLSAVCRQCWECPKI